VVTSSWMIIIYFGDYTGNTSFQHLWWSSGENQDNYLLCWWAQYWYLWLSHCFCLRWQITVHLQVITEDSVETVNWNSDSLCSCLMFRVHNLLHVSHILLVPWYCGMSATWLIFQWFMTILETMVPLRHVVYLLYTIQSTCICAVLHKHSISVHVAT
jgi:hypothetical protein